MPDVNWGQALLGPLSGLALSIFFCFKFLEKFERTTENLVTTFKTELEECNKRYNFILTELMKLKDLK